MSIQRSKAHRGTNRRAKYERAIKAKRLKAKHRERKKWHEARGKPFEDRGRW